MGKQYAIGDVVGFVDLLEKAREEFPISPTSRWYCAITNPNCEARAALGLLEIGYRTFYPRMRRWVTHARVRKAAEKPLLGRYIFVEVDEKNDRQSFYAVRAVNGIETILSKWQDTRWGKRMLPAPFKSEWVEGMLHRQVDGEWDATKGDFPIGARVRLMEGEFADMLATVTGVEGRRGRMVSFKLHGENRYGKLHVDNVRAA